jgi:hypothetical protein
VGHGGVDKFEPVSGCGDLDQAEEALCDLVAAGFDSAANSQATQEASDVVSLTV